MSGRLNSLPLALKTKALKMKIGVFDSGLGGLVITKAFIESMPQYDYLYYGDSRHLPYGENHHHCLQHRHFDSPALFAAAFPAA